MTIESKMALSDSDVEVQNFRSISGDGKKICAVLCGLRLSLICELWISQGK